MLFFGYIRLTEKVICIYIPDVRILGVLISSFERIKREIGEFFINVKNDADAAPATVSELIIANATVLFTTWEGAINGEIHSSARRPA